MKSLLEAGVHFGHQTRRWNPKMRRFIFTERNGIHILDLQQTVDRLEAALGFVADLVAEGGTILFVGTKRQAQETMRGEAMRCGMPYVITRWLGGTLTNFQTIQNRIDYLVRLEDARARGDLETLAKKERLQREEEIARLNRYLGGIKEMTALPGAVYIVDTTKEDIAVAEAQRMGIPIVALVDTNCNPDVIDYPIPSNDDAIRAIKLLTALVSDAVLDGLTAREHAQKAELEAEDVEVSAYTSTGYVASPDEPDPNVVAAQAEAEAAAAAEAEAAAAAEAAAEAAPAAEAAAEPSPDAAEPAPEAAAPVPQPEASAEPGEPAEAEAPADEPAAEPEAPPTDDSKPTEEPA
jgi:small subunit ribosomal protein S2